jgi:hypothetical protein
MKQNLIYIINEEQYTKIKSIYEIFFRKIKRVNSSDFSEEDKINSFFLEFRDYFIDLFTTKFTSNAGLIKWFDTLEKKNKVIDLFDQDRLLYYKGKFIDTWDQFVPKEQTTEVEGEIKALQTSTTPIATTASTPLTPTFVVATQGEGISLSPDFMNQLKNSFLQHIDKRFDEMGEKIDDIGLIIEDIKGDTELISFIKEETGLIKDIKDDTDAIIQMVSIIEEKFDEKLDEMEDYMKMKLGTTFEKFKVHYDNYKAGKMTKKKLIVNSLKVAGLSFAKFFTRK